MQMHKAHREAVTELKPWGSKTNFWVGLFFASLCINVLGLVFPLTLLQVYDRIIPNSATSTLLLLITAVGSALILETILRISRSLISSWADARYEHLVGCQSFIKISNVRLEDYEKEGPGKHFERINAVNLLRDFYGGQALIALFDMPFAILFFALIAFLGGWLVAIPIVVVAIFALYSRRIVERLRQVILRRRLNDDQRMNFLIQTLGGIHTVKSMGMEAQMQRRYERLQKATMQNDYDLSHQTANVINLNNVATQVTTTIMVAFGCIMVIHNHMTIGALAACVLLVGRIFNPISRALGIWTRMQSIKMAKQRFSELNHLSVEAVTKPDFPPIKGEIEFKDISFHYQDEAKITLQHVNLHIAAGECIAIKGDALSGKSTLMWLLMGGLQPTAGQILIDGKDIAAYNPQSIRAQMGYLPQNGVLFEGTILENLTMFQSNSINNEKAKAIARELGVDDVIAHLPKGYDTPVGNRAVEITPRGIIQRLCIARALIHNPTVILLDEANMSIDRQGDEILLQYLKKLKGKQTIIMITHRPSYHQTADRVFLLENSHLTLVNTNHT